MVKHYTAYSVETDRFTFSAPLSAFDLWDSNLPQYERAFVEGGASGAMCSYFAPNGVSSCGNSYLLNDVVRDHWGSTDSIIMSDCSAVGNMRNNGMNLTDVTASGTALNAGMDIYGGWGDSLWTDGNLATAVEEGFSKEEDVDKAVKRSLLAKMKVGLFDDNLPDEWTSLTVDDLASDYHKQVSYETALQGFVLLKNENSALPLKR